MFFGLRRRANAWNVNFQSLNYRTWFCWSVRSLMWSFNFVVGFSFLFSSNLFLRPVFLFSSYRIFLGLIGRSLVWSFIRTFRRPIDRSLVRSFVRTPFRSCHGLIDLSVVRLFARPPVRSRLRLIDRPLDRSFACAPVRSRLRSIVRTVIRSLIRSFVGPIDLTIVLLSFGLWFPCLIL